MWGLGRSSRQGPGMWEAAAVCTRTLVSAYEADCMLQYVMSSSAWKIQTSAMLHTSWELNHSMLCYFWNGMNAKKLDRPWTCCVNGIVEQTLHTHVSGPFWCYVVQCCNGFVQTIEVREDYNDDSRYSGFPELIPLAIGPIFPKLGHNSNPWPYVLYQLTP